MIQTKNSQPQKRHIFHQSRLESGRRSGNRSHKHRVGHSGQNWYPNKENHWYSSLRRVICHRTGPNTKIIAFRHNPLQMKLSDDHLSKVDSYFIVLRPRANLYKIIRRHYALTQKDILIKSIQLIAHVSAVYRIHTAKWAVPALAVPKPGTKRFLPSIYLRLTA